MYNQRNAAPLFSERTLFFLVFGVVTLVLVGGGIGTVSWINSQLSGFRTQAAASPMYTNYSTDPADPAKPYLQPASLAAMSKYITEHPQPQNVQILKGMDTAAIANYMVGMVAGGLKVDCTYCHVLTNGNFADDSNPQKAKARQMMLMAQDLNQNFVAQLPASVGGKQVTCATCHNGKPVNFNGGNSGLLSNYPADQSPLPDTFQLKLDAPADLDLLLITGKKDPDLAAVQYNQQTMTHFTQALGNGCAFCHNANYFPGNEQPPKAHALIMLKMAQHINATYKPIMNNKGPSCWMCHRGQQLPPGSANPGQVPEVLGYKPQ